LKGAVGKTSCVSTLFGDVFSQKYTATLGVELRKLTVETTCGPIEFSLWDTAGQEKFGGLRDGYYLSGDGALVMYDVSSQLTYKSVPMWRRDVSRVCENIPMILLANKVDQEQLRVNKETGELFAYKYKLAFFETSSKNRLSLLQPLEWMAKALVGDKTLRFAELLQHESLENLGNNLLDKTSNQIQSDLSISTRSSAFEGL